MHTSRQGSATAYVVDTTALIAVDVGTMTVSWIFRAPEGALLDLAPAVDPTCELVGRAPSRTLTHKAGSNDVGGSGLCSA